MFRLFRAVASYGFQVSSLRMSMISLSSFGASSSADLGEVAETGLYLRIQPVSPFREATKRRAVRVAERVLWPACFLILKT